MSWLCQTPPSTCLATRPRVRHGETSAAAASAPCSCKSSSFFEWHACVPSHTSRRHASHKKSQQWWLDGPGAAGAGEGGDRLGAAVEVQGSSRAPPADAASAWDAPRGGAEGVVCLQRLYRARAARPTPRRASGAPRGSAGEPRTPRACLRTATRDRRDSLGGREVDMESRSDAPLLTTLYKVGGRAVRPVHAPGHADTLPGTPRGPVRCVCAQQQRLAKANTPPSPSPPVGVVKEKTAPPRQRCRLHLRFLGARAKQIGARRIALTSKDPPLARRCGAALSPACMPTKCSCKVGRGACGSVQEITAVLIV